MVYLIDYYAHVRDCKLKQAERARRIESLTSYNHALTTSDRDILDKPVSELVEAVHSQSIPPLSILQAYGRAALRAHQKTNSVTEILISSAEQWLEDGSINLKGPLAGIPISLKDSVAVAGYDTTIGYSSNVGNKKEKDGTLTRLLKDAGAVPYVKTNLPITLLSFESTNDVWGQTTNPHNNKYSPGGSTGGEAALLAAGGSRIGIGSDVAGSVRVPAHWSGIYSLRCSTGRWPKTGVVTSTLGQEGIPSVFSPMTRTLPDLSYFTKSLIGMKPWTYDHSVHPIPWRSDVFEQYSEKKRFKIGVLRTDGVVDPSPACMRAIDEVVAVLKKEGHEVVDVHPPSPYEALPIASQLLNADGCKTFLSFFRTFEWNDLGSAQMAFLMALPRPLRYIYWAWVKYVRKDEIWADLVGEWREKTVEEQWKLVAKRELYKVKWHEWWQQEAKIDFMITTPNATPAVPHGGMHDAFTSCGYTFLFNLLDYTAGVMPITHVDKARDQLPSDFNIKNLNGVAQGAYKHYDATAMHGLPVGVQIVGQRLEEEKVLAIMQRIEDALGDDMYQQLEID